MTKELKPTWTVYIDKDGKPQATLDKRDKGVIGYVSAKLSKDAISYCNAMGFNNSYNTDHSPMRPWDRGEILFLLANKLSPLSVAEKTNRSIDWVMIVGGITGRARQELIDWYHEHKEEQDDGEYIPTKTRRRGKAPKTRGKKKTNTGIQGSSKRNTDKAVHFRGTKKAVPRYTTKRHKDNTALRKRPNHGDSTGKQGIVDSLRDAKDYVGD